MKKYIAGFIAVILMLGTVFCGCGSKSSTGEIDSSSSVAESMQSEVTTGEESGKESTVISSKVESSEPVESSEEESSEEEPKEIETFYLKGTVNIDNLSIASDFEGEPEFEEGEFDVTGILAKDADTDRYFVELYEKVADGEKAKTPWQDDALLSYWAVRKDDEVSAKIGDKDSWLFNLYLIESENEDFSFDLSKRKASIVYEYADGIYTCDVTIAFRHSDVPYED